MGKDILISWDTLFMDTDFHYVSKVGEIDNAVNEKEIIIGNHVWIGCRATVLKGAALSDNCVVAAGSVVTKSFKETSTLIAGNPVAVKRQGVEWVDERQI